MKRDDLGFLDSINWREPDEVDDDGGRRFNIRCRVPFSAPAPGFAEVGKPVSRAGHMEDEGDGERVIDDSGEGVLLDPLASGDSDPVDEVDFDEPLLAGIASSTSVDFFGTEMSLRALKQMAAQMITENGIPYLPRHNLGAGGAMEWDSVIGRTVHAEVVPVEADQLRAPKNPAESHFALRVTTALYDDEPLARSLVKRISRGEKIGQSIGGWFTALQVLQNEEGDVERVIVLGVELDHLAVTRAPANPDAVGLVSLRSAIAERAKEARVEDLLSSLGEAPVALRSDLLPVLRDRIAEDERHILAVVDNGDGTVSVTYSVHDEETEEVDEVDEMETEEEVEEEVEAEDEVDETSSEEDERSAVESAPSPEILGLSEDRAPEPKPEQTSIASDSESETRSLVGSIELDETREAVQDTSVNDARRSAPLDTPNPSPISGDMSEERQMSEQPTAGLTLDAIRSLLDEKLAPVTARVDALEGSADRSQPTPTPEPVDETASLRAKLEAEQTRARAAEAALAHATSRGFRVGRSAVGLNMPSGPAARSAFSGLIERSRSEAPTLSAVAERALPALDPQIDEKPASRETLIETLRSLCNAAEADGLITPTAHRAAWQ
jgi:hypothetical protein